ncbi:ribonuclease HI [Rickettsia endosymbiont of Cardiosporidium cionae]|uniref:ribonuclease HI n=1 Tax=Rickettsia endosymbiont of Cardiosporidium cionae TaxID=2777155 RepID=UPI001894666C|nr:ribonuclease HI [Rickettsia endosymbiont of Cardiosporidium cionae]KAF8818741.1 ribonuclease HI [Rickettsia endosymbiont of Cardiosporidium cionae]
MIKIYTDGACANNPGPGGWGAYLELDDKTTLKISGYELNTTNNQMEITAAIESLMQIKESSNIIIYTDSKYLQQAMTSWIYKWQKNNWCKSDNKPVKNIELWKKLILHTKKHNIEWIWVKGHNDNYGNIKADQLAVTAKDIAIQKLRNQVAKNNTEYHTEHETAFN